MSADPKDRKWIVKKLLCYALGAVLFLALLLPVRGALNITSRTDYIFQRLDDYPRIYENYRKETEEWWEKWQNADYEKRSEQAAFIFQHDKKHDKEEEKLSYIAKMLDAEQAFVIPADDYKRTADEMSLNGLNSCYATLPDDRLLVLGIRGVTPEEMQQFTEDSVYFMSQIQAGLPGYVLILNQDSLSIYPQDSNEDAIRGMIGSMIENGKLDPAGLKEEAAVSDSKTASRIVMNSKISDVPDWKYTLHCTAYADNEDLLINVAETAEQLRFGRKRTWSLWFLCCSIMVLLGICLWKAKLYIPGESPAAERKTALKRGISALIFACILMTVSITVVQNLSNANLSQQGATDQAEYLKRVLERESDRADRISAEFDRIYGLRAGTAATLLSDNPQLVDLDSLHSLDRSLGGSGLRVYDAAGELLGSDDVLLQTVTTKYSSASHQADSGISSENENKVFEGGIEENSGKRYYRDVMLDKKGRTTGWVELEIRQEQLDKLLSDTDLKELISDLNIMDTIHVVVVEPGTDGKIIACTHENWVGDSAEQFGIHPDLFFDGYEGIVDFQGSKCYSVVFGYGDNYVVVGSEDVSFTVLIGGILILLVPLALILTFLVYRQLVSVVCDYQKKKMLSEPDAENYLSRSEYPSMGEYFKIPGIIRTPEYWGVSELPTKNLYFDEYGGCNARINFECLEKDREMLTYRIYRELVAIVNELN